MFPGLIYRMVRPRIVLLIFVSGKVVLTGKSLNLVSKLHDVSLAGAKERSQIMEAFNNIYPILKNFKKTT